MANSKILRFVQCFTTLKMIEWIETVTILGANKIVVNVALAHPNMWKVLKFYEKSNKFQIQQNKLPNVKSGRIYNQMIAINDCFYRNMFNFKFITSLDIDELIIPSKPEDTIC